MKLMVTIQSDYSPQEFSYLLSETSNMRCIEQLETVAYREMRIIHTVGWEKTLLYTQPQLVQFQYI